MNVLFQALELKVQKNAGIDLTGIDELTDDIILYWMKCFCVLLLLSL
ncbi:hypothetical protein OENI_230001 [Oenococcus oeni]|uniref:Uncharacterized protein n=1 Tax=Oenococcus oeni TaxID=1247 RepID=A0AAQ2UTW9_OENOE|nr:hypothetical protein OENI_230001 [Oenococcus oeni]SYW07482.1 hypothetical protein OENI_720003 [Oenococcus oeni]SYW10578.1 hypothetical protein OENI_330003 [Oenococcus oeni]SYW12283.1 hypothetical protein OENI_200003 [Oenococcus oeni]SYW13440.1 hypothetical protein OENI_1220001 [Oenococcus oeni]